MPWVDAELRKWFNIRDKLLVLAHSSSETRTGPAWDKYKEMRNYCKSQLKLKMKKFYEEKTASHFQSSKKFWSFYQSVVKTKKTNSSAAPLSIIDEDGTRVFDEKLVANRFNKFFTTLSAGKNFDDSESLEFIDRVFSDHKKSNRIAPPSNLFEFNLTNTEEVLKIIKECDSQSSAGIASIPTVLIKECAHVICSPLTKIFNSCILSNYMPNEWKTAIAVPLFKKGAVDDPNCYRSISLLAPVAKFYEKILADRILEYFSTNNMFCAEQHGFRSGYSCETALQSILDDWKKLIDDKSIIIAIFIDFTKAFDLVKQKLLSRKLFHYGFSNNALKLMENYFDSRTQITKVNNTLSNAMPIELGVPQGSILGPLLFLIFINDMSLSTDFHSILFADDTTLYDSDSDLSVLYRKFNRKFQVVYEWISMNQMSLNWSKTKIMFLTKKKVEIPEEK